ncbi:uncharacterized protein LOC107261032 [Ricinus communis]|uniref:uncharacterized protein LOC107261032 n=1 Tax=Ricinus communis TaxID=3988 RepID=UPI0007723A91|nr:uncharacterized protein LOC107261032 [Ricinus communis]|eukprot:XP_015573020.1 uncharacterized protein LOC107261032 [Ricinus communis]
MEKFISTSEIRFQTTKTALRNQQASIQTLENQVGQIAKLLSERPPRSLPSNTEANPMERLKVITLQSGKELKTKMNEVYENSTMTKKIDDEQKGLHINIPFVEALLQMPKYGKFLKELLSNKRKLEQVSMVQLSKKSSTIIQKRLPKKLKDPGSFTIPCFIGNLNVDNTLADLGASISAMPYNLFTKLGLGEPKPTLMSIQLADTSIVYPRGIIEDLLVKVQEFIFLMDFMVINMDETVNVSPILGRPFLAIARAIIDVHDGKLILKVGEEQVTF